MAIVRIESEVGVNRGWSYAVLVRHDAGGTTRHTVRLDWADHDLWSGGAVPPSHVVCALMTYVLENRVGGGLPETFDAARARRWLPAIDRELRAAI